MKLISLVAYFSAGDSPSDTPNDSKKRRKSHAKTTSENQPSSEIASPAISLERLTLLMDALLYRHHGFNSSVLSEATASFLSLPLVGILIRILSNMLHGVCNCEAPWRLPISAASAPSSKTQQTPYLEYNDNTLGNIVTWLESLLESHHTSILFAIKSSSSSSSSDSLVQSLLCLVKAMKQLPSSMNLAESTFGMSMHYQRLMKYQSRSFTTSQAMKEKSFQQIDAIGNDNYQLEVVRFF